MEAERIVSELNDELESYHYMVFGDEAYKSGYEKALKVLVGSVTTLMERNESIDICDINKIINTMDGFRHMTPKKEDKKFYLGYLDALGVAKEIVNKNK